MEKSMQTNSRTFIFVLGPPGSGKGTLCKAAVNRLETSFRRHSHLSVGDYLRELCLPDALSNGTDDPRRDMIRDYLQHGRLLPADVLIPLLKSKIDSATDRESSAATTWLIDGFPRNMETALAFENRIGKPAKVITLECAREAAEGRFLSRSREAIDDKMRFDKRYGEYVENMKTINAHYADVMEIARVDGNPEQCLVEFMAALVADKQ